jgi:perosamine synthetase
MIPVNQPLITKQDATAVFKSVKSGWVSSAGPQIELFENKFKKTIGKKYCSLVANGTAALEIAIKALNLKKNDEIIIPNFTIISNVFAVIKQGLKPVVIDCDLETWNMKIDDVEKAITKKTKAIIAVHIYGYPLDMERLLKISRRNKIFLIEDAAEMIGNKFKENYCGFYGDISTFSFYANKHITTGEGGAVLTNSKNLYNKIEELKNLCFGKINKYNHTDLGWNYRFTNMQAALGLSQLRRLKSIINKKIEIGKIYYENLKNNKNFYIQKPRLGIYKNIYWVIGLLIKNKKFTANIIRKKLKRAGIETRAFFWPMHKQTVLKKLKIQFNKKFPNSEYLSKYGFYLPSGIGIRKEQIKKVCLEINKIF